MKYFFRILFMTTIFVSPVLADWPFKSEPATFEDCVLEKMKGQDKSMRSFAVKACRSIFPYEADEFMNRVPWITEINEVIRDSRWVDIDKKTKKLVMDLFFEEKFEDHSEWKTLPQNTKTEVYYIFYDKVIKTHRKIWPGKESINDLTIIKGSKDY